MNQFETWRYSWNSSFSLPFLCGASKFTNFFTKSFQVISWHILTHFSKLETLLHIIEKDLLKFLSAVRRLQCTQEGFSGQPVCLTCKSEVSICNTVDTVILSHQRIKANQNAIGRQPNERYPRKQCFKCSH